MNNDPCKGCDVYKEIGCAHVDRYLCDFPKCSILIEYLEVKDHYICDCNRLGNFGKSCKYPEKYKDGKCK